MCGQAMPTGGWQATGSCSGIDPREILILLTGGARGRRHHGRGGRPGYGPQFGSWGGGPFGRGPRARRGDVRAALLVLLEEEPRNGYGLMQEIERRSNGVWRPSPGSVYPALQQLEDEGLVQAVESGGRKLFELTDAGREYVAEHRDRLAEPWAAVAGDVGEGVSELRGIAGQVTAALMQVAFTGSDAQVEEAKRILADARRSLYRILAEDEPRGDDEPRGEDEPRA
jgi:DNA-binding PadR family transcriptional regulator